MLIFGTFWSLLRNISGHCGQCRPVSTEATQKLVPLSECLASQWNAKNSGRKFDAILRSRIPPPADKINAIFLGRGFDCLTRFF
jgi:hypothetical protein